ncbi:NADH:flavin oxidoreductase [Paenibacillus durus]|uniref:Oxidoreductase n=1 Tax=Paenibacillus durus ATCC 35681 TaxID=1333534 RepID=A0A0F7FEL7_PAEDU|nr:NADH:flavin oxidoreductase [Paenibacillus durus]AKG37065.1 oxidoreductase [Paenibacillus durus ATCC 35681]
MKTLFDETRINGIQLKNRLIRSATHEGLADKSGHLTDEVIKVYQDLAEGGVGLIITGVAYITEDSKYLHGMMGFYDDSFIPEYRKMTDIAHANDCPIIIQLAYAAKDGEMWTADAPSTEEIKAIVKPFGESALRAKRAGFDGVQIHAGHRYFLSQLLSPSKNGRQDEYGGSLENRTRLIVEIYDEIRRRAGEDFGVFIKLNSTDLDGDDEVFASCRYLCKQLADRGIDGIEISGGYGPFMPSRSFPYKESVLRDDAALIAKDVQVPVILVGLNRTPAVMEEILNTTDIEYFAISRPLIHQPDLPNLWREQARHHI